MCKELKEKNNCLENNNFPSKILPIEQSCETANLEYVQVNILLTAHNSEIVADLNLQIISGFFNADLLLFDVTFLMYRKMRGKGKVNIVYLLHKRNCEEC